VAERFATSYHLRYPSFPLTTKLPHLISGYYQKMSPPVGIFRNIVAKGTFFVRLAIKSASDIAKGKTQAVPVYARVAPRQPIHPSAFARQSKRWLHTQRQVSRGFRQFSTQFLGTKQAEARNVSSRIALAIKQSTGHSPFASTLRPNLTGGAFPRTAGGYSLGSGKVGNGVRYFSHTPQSAAQVVHNVSHSMRAFTMGGKRVQFDGVDSKTGTKRFRGVTALQDDTLKSMNSVPKATPGSYIDFQINPTITALTSLRGVTGFKPANNSMATLHTEGLLDILSVDFSRALQELMFILNDLKALSSLGDMPISYQDTHLRVHFPGCDAETVERIASELDLRRGVIGQDEDFDAFVGTEIALLFPFAPSESTSQPSLYGMTMYDKDELLFNDDMSSIPDSSPVLSLSDGLTEDYNISSPFSPSQYASIPSSELRDTNSHPHSEQHTPLEYQEFEGIYRFIDLCNNAQIRS
jgi:hypothetical protein